MCLVPFSNDLTDFVGGNISKNIKDYIFLYENPEGHKDMVCTGVDQIWTLVVCRMSVLHTIFLRFRLFWHKNQH